MENNEKELEERELKELELMNENENREFYVYVHIRLDNNTVFYVGKGHGNRAYNLSRGEGTHHDNICKACDCKAVIIKNNLTESQAFRLESKMIKYYVHTLGYGIDIEGYNDYDHSLPHLTNRDWGGMGGKKGIKKSEEAKRKQSESMKGNVPWNKGKKGLQQGLLGEKNGMYGKTGKENPMYGKNPEDFMTEKAIKEKRRKQSEAKKGKNNNMYGKNAYANKTPEEMKIIANKKSNSMKGKTAGEKNGMWGKPSHNRKKVICITTGKIFDCIKYAAEYYNVKYNSITNCCKGKYKTSGKLSDGTKLQWCYLENYNNEYNGILINPIINK